jgi:hypothetical protein
MEKQPEQKTKLPRTEYWEKQKQQALGDLNRWYAGEKLGHEPDDEEAAKHFIEQGGAEAFAETHEIDLDKEAKQNKEMQHENKRDCRTCGCR